ncbi:glycosyltransferase family 2 protein [Agromyces cerinus]|uniref:Glycosyl transferase family 2 n=1 Tax=Agromyces cerinus subsp. cerinus TaxID=232089 RepID=A0A1N6DIM7_9MICO|nr:glycosyltransferase family A protein [Agromyces cerinus]SIN70534.1 Glycosyl transferase family 2 [Agromyces cerinus subsp. cerinus]
MPEQQAQPAVAPRVSIVVPTYRSGQGLERLFGSLRAQTLRSDEFEIIIVDDGSPEEDAARIADLTARQPNARFHRIDHSGWPSRPRNVGIDLAAGEFVLFADHDDELYPTSLENALETLDRTGADVFAGKEARTDQAKWGLDVFDGNYDDAGLREDAHPLVPTNPHKLYRVALLREHAVRFPEGGRQLWEDVHFNVDVARHTSHVAIRSDEPFYHWVRDGRTTSTSFGENVEEWWTALGLVIEHIAAGLDRDTARRQRGLLLGLQFRERVLPAVGPALLQRSPADRALVLAHATRLVSDYADPEIVRSLPKHLQARAHLLRIGRPDLVESLAAFDDGILGISFASSVEVGNDGVRLETSTTWMAHHGGFLDVRIDGGKVRRALTPELERELGPELLMIDDDIASASSRIGLRSRDTAMTWLVPTETTMQVSDDPYYPSVTARSVAFVDPETLRHGLPMADGYWDFNARNELFGVINHRAVRAVRHGGRSEGARDLRVYANIHGNLSLQIR